MRRWLEVAVVCLPALTLALLGLSHPHHLTVESAQWWTTLHIILVPIFPFLALPIWVLLRDDHGILGWTGRIASLAFAVFYGALDAIAGIATGTVTTANGSAAGADIDALFSMGRVFGIIGGWAFLVAVGALLGSFWLAHGPSVLLIGASVILLAGGLLFTTSHIYWPKGSVAMLCFAVGFLLLAMIRQRAARLTTT